MFRALLYVVWLVPFLGICSDATLLQLVDVWCERAASSCRIKTREASKIARRHGEQSVLVSPTALLPVLDRCRRARVLTPPRQLLSVVSAYAVKR
jgi:hypothetical protein